MNSYSNIKKNISAFLNIVKSFSESIRFIDWTFYTLKLKFFYKYSSDFCQTRLRNFIINNKLYII